MSAAVTREDRGSWIPWLFAVFLLVVLAANGALIWLERIASGSADLGP